MYIYITPYLLTYLLQAYEYIYIYIYIWAVFGLLCVGCDVWAMCDLYIPMVCMQVYHEASKFLYIIHECVYVFMYIYIYIYAYVHTHTLV